MENKVVRRLVLDYVKKLGPSEDFDIEVFIHEYKIFGLKERNCITKLLRDMVLSVNNKCEEIAKSAKSIAEMKDDTEKERCIELFCEDYNISHAEWMALTVDERFEHTKKIMEAVGIYYRILETKNSRKIWINPNFEQRLEKTKDVSYSRLGIAIKNMWTNMKLLMLDDTEKKTAFECSSEISVIVPLKHQLRELGGMMDKKIEQLNARMSKLLGGGDTKGIQ